MAESHLSRDELLAAGAQELKFKKGVVRVQPAILEALLDVWEPMIRADERERTNTVGGHRQIRDEGRADMCNDLRDQVEALPVQWQALGEVWVKRAQVLALFTGNSDD